MEERLRKFATLVELGSFTKAADSLHLSQPALSTSIKKLERELKEPLLIRGSQPLALTTAGEYAYAAAKEISISTHNLTHKLEQLRLRKPTITIGMIDSVAEAVFESHTIFVELEKHAHISLIVDNSRNLSAAVGRGELDSAFVVEPSMRSADESIAYTLIGHEPLLTVCSKTVLPTLQASLAKGKLSPFISYDRSSNTYRLISQAYTQAKIRLQPTFYSTSPSVMVQLVAADRGAAVLPYLLVADMLEQDKLRTLPVAAVGVISRPIAWITQRGRDLPPLLTTAAHDVGLKLSTLHEMASEIDK